MTGRGPSRPHLDLAAVGSRHDEAAVGVDLDEGASTHPDLVRAFDGVEGYTAASPGWLQRIFEEGIQAVSESGVLGDVRGARPEVGDAVCAALADELADYFSRELGI